MNRCLPTMRRAIVTLVAIALLPTAESVAQNSQYQAPAMAMPSADGVQQIPVFAASPLAGGPAAAEGGQFMDVQGNPIVLPASYCQGAADGGCYPGGYGGGGMGGYGDPMAVDFGGYGQDQCGPHYFDISADVVFLQATELFNGVGAFTSAGVGLNAPRFLNPNNNLDDYEPGWQIAARYDIGALAVLEASYMGLYDIGFNETVVSAEVTPGNLPNSLFTPFSAFGTTVPLANGFDDGNMHSLDYQSDLQSTEFSYRRYWVGTNPRVSGTWLLGARYLRLTEDLNFNSIAIEQGGVNPIAANRLWSSENDMVGFQLGGDGWICLRQGLRVGGEAKAGIYNNHYKFRNAVTVDGVENLNTLAVADQVAFAAEGGATVVADILPSWSIRGGYRVLYLNSLATVGASIDTTTVDANIVGAQAHALYHGFHGGLEYVW